MAEHLQQRPVKGILKKTDSVDPGEHLPTHDRRSSASSHEGHKEMKWDEMNILATHHPEGKDYGHMKIEEPKTPYSHEIPHDADLDYTDGAMDVESNSDDREGSGVNAASLVNRLKEETKDPGHAHHPMVRIPSLSNDEDDEVDESEMTPEEREKRRQFKEHRKEHYNEYMMVKKAKDLLQKEGIDAMEGGDQPQEDANMSA